MKEPTTIPDGVAHNIATSAASLLDDATACIEDPTPQNVADLLASMRIMQHRLAKALQEVEEEPRAETRQLRARTQLHWIKFVTPADRGRLYLGFDGAGTAGQVLVDLSPLLAQGGAFEPLRDPARFAAAEVGPGGRTLVWHIGEDVVDLSADALWLMAHPDDDRPRVE